MLRLVSAALGLMFASGAMAAPSYAPSGPQTNVAMSTVTSGGWTNCFSEPFGTYGTSIASAVSGCSGDLLMMAAAPNGDTNFQLLAWAPKADVMYETFGGNVTHNANGSEWYFNGSWSWGFAPGGSTVSLSSCDTTASTSFGGVNGTTPQRMCWHTDGDALSGGWRVGANDFLNYEPTGYTKYLLTASSVAAVPEPETYAMLLAGLGVLGFMGKRRKVS
jgi:hypothetical protein